MTRGFRSPNIGKSHHKTVEQRRGQVHQDPAEGRLLRRKSVARVRTNFNTVNPTPWLALPAGSGGHILYPIRNVIVIFIGQFFMFFGSDDLRTANIIACDPEGVSCLVIDRETFNQLIAGLDEIRTRYKDDDVLERMR